MAKKEPTLSDEIKHMAFFLNKTNKILAINMFLNRANTWNKTTGKILSSIIGALIASAWASTPIIYAYTNDTFWLKVFFVFIAIALIIGFQLMWIKAIVEVRSLKNVLNADMKDMDKPSDNDPNTKFFVGYKNHKYRVIDSKAPEHNKQYFLYPIYARINENNTMTFFKSTQITQVSSEN